MEQTGHFEIRAVSDYTLGAWMLLAVIAVHVFAMAYIVLRYRLERRRRVRRWTRSP